MANEINQKFLESMNITTDYKSGIQSLIPTNAKIFLETVIGNKKDPITIKDFTKDEVEEIKKAVLHSKQYGSATGLFDRKYDDAVRYSNYPNISNPSRLINTFTPQGRVATTLGQFGYEVLSNGDVKILDHYDFMPVPEGGLVETNPFYKLLRTLGTKNLGEKTSAGRSFDLVLPKEIFSDEEYKILSSTKTDTKYKPKVGDVD
jgi:hypothetical protein